MKFLPKIPPRIFRVGIHKEIEMADCGDIWLEPNEQVTFVTPSGKRHDFAAKSWGFYATPSVNSRLVKEGLKTALVRNWQGRYYIMVVDPEHMGDFQKYLRKDRNKVIEWLDERPAEE